jgi:hypothetical protein
VKLYIAGPMRGRPEMNFPAFLEAAKTLRERGHEVRCPAEPEPGFDPHDLRPAIGNVLQWIATQADALILLPGWEMSLGARAEMATALAVGIPVYRLTDFLVD